MSREIKFRAWFAKDKAMAHVDKLEFNGSFLNSPVHADVSAKTDFEKGGWYTPLRSSTNRKTVIDGSKEQVPRVVLMQFIGLVDKNGIQIFEGDIIPVNGQNCYVVYHEEYARFCLQMKSGRMFIPSKNSEVIGNIYEHPHLLEVAE